MMAGLSEGRMSDGMLTAVVIANVVLGLMTLGVAVYVFGGGIVNVLRAKKQASQKDSAS